MKNYISFLMIISVLIGCKSKKQQRGENALKAQQLIPLYLKKYLNDSTLYKSEGFGSIDTVYSEGINQKFIGFSMTHSYRDARVSEDFIDTLTYHAFFYLNKDVTAVDSSSIEQYRKRNSSF